MLGPTATGRSGFPLFGKAVEQDDNTPRRCCAYKFLTNRMLHLLISEFLSSHWDSVLPEALKTLRIHWDIFNKDLRILGSSSKSFLQFQAVIFYSRL